MIRSLLRMLKHISLAVLAIVSAVCIAEVGLRGYQLYRHCDSGGSCELAPRPCAVAFQKLPPLQHITRPGGPDGAAIAIRTNRLGLRGPVVTIPKARETIRIVCLGDDATFAADVSEEQTFAARVQQQLSRQSGSPVEVVNAGIPGYCPLLTLAWARQHLVSLQPDLVILCCDRTDVADDRRVRPLARYAEDGTLEAICHPAAAQQPHNLVQAIEQEFQLAGLLRRQLSASLNDGADSEDLAAAWAHSDSSTAGDALQIRQAWEPIAALRDLCDQISADFVVAIIPSRTPGSGPAPSQDWTWQLLAEATSQSGVPYLDVTGDFAATDGPALFSDSTGALSADGHQLFAELLSWAILSRNGQSATAPSSATPGEITPASATQAAETSSFQRSVPLAPASPQAETTPAAGPIPLPTIRRPRTSDDDPVWAQ